MQRIHRGASLAQYAIVIALIMTAVVPGYFLYGKQIVHILSQYTDIFADINDLIGANTAATATPSTPPATTTPPTTTTTPPTTTTTTGSITPPPAVPIVSAGSLGGTPSDPVRSCSGSYCTIDYGSYVINGIPADFSSFVETCGTTAGTEVILSVLDQIIYAADHTTDMPMSPSELAIVRDLAEKGHLLADGEKDIEDYITNGDLAAMSSSAITSTDERTVLSLKVETLGLAEGENFENTLAALKALDDTTMSPDIKNLVGLLGDQINTMFYDFDGRASSMAMATAPTTEEQEAFLANYFASHTVSNLTNIDSAIICGLGNGASTGTSCD